MHIFLINLITSKIVYNAVIQLVCYHSSFKMQIRKFFDLATSLLHTVKLKKLNKLSLVKILTKQKA